MFNCSFNREVSSTLMNTLSNYQPNLTQTDVLTLNLEMDDPMELPSVWLISGVLQKIWDLRKEKKKCDLIRIRADLEAKVSLLRETRYKESAKIISQMLSNM